MDQLILLGVAVVAIVGVGGAALIALLLTLVGTLILKRTHITPAAPTIRLPQAAPTSTPTRIQRRSPGADALLAKMQTLSPPAPPDPDPPAHGFTAMGFGPSPDGWRADTYPSKETPDTEGRSDEAKTEVFASGQHDFWDDDVPELILDQDN